jgi:hypothetical protein
VDKMRLSPRIGHTSVDDVYGRPRLLVQTSPGVVLVCAGDHHGWSQLMTVGGTVKKAPVAILAASLLLAACGGGAKPDASSTSTSPSTYTSAPTVSVSSTTAPAIDPNIPAAARAHTPAGAEAFVRYFYSQVNAAWTAPSSGLISTLSSPGCKSCAELEATAHDLTQKKQHYDGPPVTIVSVGALAEASPGQLQILVTFVQEHRNVVDASGHVALTDQRKSGKFVATLGWSNQGWSVAAVKSLV